MLATELFVSVRLAVRGQKIQIAIAAGKEAVDADSDKD